MRNFILAITAAAALSTVAAISTVALATTVKPEDYRRTLFAPVGQDMLVLEAPKGMCFLDPSKYSEGSIFRLMAAVESKKGLGVLLGVFSPCTDIANIGNGPHGEKVLSAGSIVWLNPSVGERTPMEKSDYLDMREPTWKADVQKQITQMEGMEKDFRKMSEGEAVIASMPGGLEDYTFEDNVRRTQDGVSIGYTHDIGSGYEKTRTISVVATTSLRHYPVEIALRLNATDDGYEMEDAHALMDKIVAQQSALND